MPVLDPDLARRVAEGIAALLSRWAPDARPWPEDLSGREFAEKLRRHDLREVLYLPDLRSEPAWPQLWNPNDPNHERVFLRVRTERERVEFASAVFGGSLVHWEVAVVDAHGRPTYERMTPDRHWSLKLDPVETLVREMGLTLVPPAAMTLSFGRWTLLQLLDPRAEVAREAAAEVERIADSVAGSGGARGTGQTFARVLGLVRTGYDLASIARAIDGRTPTTIPEVQRWLSEEPPFGWTRQIG